MALLRGRTTRAGRAVRALGLARGLAAPVAQAAALRIVAAFARTTGPLRTLFFDPRRPMPRRSCVSSRA